MRIGQWFQLRGTLALPPGRYRVVRESTTKVEVRSRKGDLFVLSPEQFDRQCELVTTGPNTRGVHREIPFEEHGLLAAFGYHVGRDGLPPPQRHSLLERLASTPAAALPHVGREDYRAEWGEASTRQRLDKLWHCLRSFAENAAA